VERVRAGLPELPAARKERLAREYGLTAADAAILAANRALGDYFEAVAAATGNAKLSSTWVLGDVSGYLNAAGLEVRASRVGPAALAELLALIGNGTLSGKMAKEVFEAMTESGRSAAEVVAERGLGQISDTGELERIVDVIVAANPAGVEEFRAGKERIVGFFVGQVMKETRGQANPQLVNDLLRARLQRG
jgi:aspartyl-tRNA(Asn)/glutamyl-tRNA(Gln) amidotransferase subunit B